MLRPGDTTIVLDSGAILGLARGNRTLRAFVTKADQRGDTFVVPMVVLAETVRGSGPRDAPINMTLAQFEPHPPLVEATARLAGALLAAARSNSTIDALVVAEAINRQPSLLVTSDVADLAPLLDGRPGVSLERF